MLKKYNIINFRNDNKLISKMIELWNHEVGFIFPFSQVMFNQKTIECQYINYESSFVVLNGDDVIAFVISKIYDNNKIMSKYINKGWISLLYVSRDFRRQGIGGYILDKAEAVLKENGVEEILFGADYDNFFPGIPADFDNLTEPFLTKRGYVCGKYTHDLIRRLDDVGNIEKPKDITIRYATKEDKEIVLDFFEKYFYGRWYFEALEYFKDDEICEEYLISFSDDIMTGFLRVNKQKISKISYNLNWKDRFSNLVGIGPLGVRNDYRRQKIAKKLLNYALIDCYEQGYSDAIIDWTGLMEIYQKFQFEVWKCYQYASKKLNK